MEYQEARNVAYIIATAVGALIEAMGMIAENQQREITGSSPAFVHEDFIKLIDRSGVHHNAILTNMP